MTQPRTNAKSEAEQAGILVWGTIAARATEALAPLLILYLMGESDVGAFAALMLLYRTVLVLLTAGFPRAVLYFLVDASPPARRAIVRRLTRLNFALGALAGAMFVLIGVFGPDALQGIGTSLAERVGRDPDPGGIGGTLAHLPLLAVFAVFDVPARLLPNILLAEQRPRASAGVGVLYSLGLACGTLVPAAAGLGVAGIVQGIAAFGVVYGVFFSISVRRLYARVNADAHAQIEAGSIPSTRELVRFSFPLGVTDIVNTLHTSLDLWLITMLFPLQSVAHYKAGAWQIPIITTVAYSVGSVYLPRFSGLYRAGRAREALEEWRESIHKVSLIVVPATLVFLVGAEEFCAIVFPDGYEPAAGVFRAYCFLTLGRVTAFGSLLLAAGRPRFVLQAAALTLSANAIISVALVFTVGFLGPAVGTALSFVPSVYVYCWYIARASGVPISSTFPLVGYLRALFVAVPACALAVGLKLWLPVDPGRLFLIEALVVLGGYSLVGTLTGLVQRDDWRFLWDWMRLRPLR
jgi:O-antigen/teichoic acid export membrane protein